MKYSIVYSTRTGNTRMLAEAAREEIGEGNVTYFGAPSDEALGADIIMAGFWTDKGMPDDASAAFLGSLRNARVFLFGTAGFGESESYYRAIEKRAEALLDPSVIVIGSYMCQGKMPQSVRERYMKMKEGPSRIPNLDSLIENFDRALSHPDERDLSKMKEAVSKAL